MSDTLPAAPVRPTRAELMGIFGNAKVVRQFELLFDYLTGAVTAGIDTNAGTATRALTLAEAGRLGVFNARAPRAPSVAAGSGLKEQRTAAGVTLSADLGYLIPAIVPFLPRATPVRPKAPAPDAAGAIIAMQVFSRR